MIQASGLKKTFVEKRSLREILLRPFQKAKQIRAVRGVDLEVHQGEVLSLLGPNGAGKTTLIKMLTCLVLPDEGEAIIDGVDVTKERAVKQRIGLVQTDERSFYWRLSARENLEFFARLYDVPGPRIAGRIAELLEKVDMTAAADRPFSTYSAGMKQRIAIARALLHDPPIVFMDEPTRSLDPASSMALREFVRDELKDRDGKTILIATHDLREAEAVSDRVAIMVAGRVRAMGPVEEIRRWGLDERFYSIELKGHGSLAETKMRIQDEHEVGDRLHLRVCVDRDEPLNGVLQSILASGYEVIAFSEYESDLEEAFKRILDADRAASDAHADRSEEPA